MVTISTMTEVEEIPIVIGKEVTVVKVEIVVMDTIDPEMDPETDPEMDPEMGLLETVIGRLLAV